LILNSARRILAAAPQPRGRAHRKVRKLPPALAGQGEPLMTKSLHRVLFVAAGIAAASLFAGAAQAGTSVEGEGIAVGGGVKKVFDFEAEQLSAVTLAAEGHVFLAQFDSTGAFGNFVIKGKVVCLRVAGNHAIVGLIIKKGQGTAATHVGEAFYLLMNDNHALHVPDLFDNSGYTGTATANCTIDGAPAGVVTKGAIRIETDADNNDDHHDNNNGSHDD
jgi:hypothetical protein